MATVEPCETQSSGLPGISNTLNLYDSFKPPHEDEKDSDDESFHLPMLDADDDLESTKAVSTKTMGKEINGDETEDDILNKFETNGTPDIDPKMEDRLLDEIDNILDKKLDENSFDTPPQPQDVSGTDNKESNLKKSNDADCSVHNEMEMTEKKENIIEGTETAPDQETPNNVDIPDKKEDSKVESDEQETKIEEKEGEIIVADKEGEIKVADKEGEIIVVEEGKTIVAEKEGNTIDEEKEESVCEAGENQQKTEVEIEADNEHNEVQEEKEEKHLSESDKTIKDTVNETVPGEVSFEEINEKTDCEIDTSVQEKSDTDSLTDVKSQEKNYLEESNDNSIETVKEVDSSLKDKKSETGYDVTLQTNNSVEAMDVDNDEKEMTNNDDICNEVSSKDEDSNQCTENPDGPDKTSSDKLLEKEQINCTNESEVKESVAINNKDDGTDNCENSNDCEDLLDISIIRDADEDNASAIAEDANDAHPSEKSDNDNDDQEEGSAENETELDESEMDQEDNLLNNDKDDNMDFDDGSSNCDQDITISGNVSDSESKNNVEVTDMTNDSKDISAVLKQTSDVNDVELSSEKNGIEEENHDVKDVMDNTTTEGNKVSDNVKETSTQVSGKRSLSEADDTDSPIKKIKLSEQYQTDEKISTRKNAKVKTLVSFEKFMQNKKLENKLTRSDLEQFCLQKICEAIMHKTEVGELHQTIKKQEQVIENLRKDLQQLTKQTRDLDIVNKKLMNELRSQNGTKKPLVPLKITRSVGLQVKLNAPVENNNRRKAPMPTTPRTPANNSTPARPRTIAPAASSVVRQVASSPRKTTTAAPLLSQALQTRQVTPAGAVNKRPPIRPKPTESQKPVNSSVIDLTDEDDKASKGAVGNPMKIINKTIPLSTGKAINIIPAKTNHGKTVAVGQVKAGVGAKVGTPTRGLTTLSQGVRLTQTQVKNGSIAIPANVVTSSSGTTQFMYVVQPGPVVTTTAGGTQKAVLLNFQPTNGVLTSTLNGSAVSVLPSKASNTVQLKTVATIRKHPAPLPSPPPITANASLKPLLPKPHLSIRKTDTGIILQWRMPYNLDIYEAIASYQLFAYQETNAPPSTDMWRKVGDVKALALPMACTLTQFADKNKYYFAVRSIDVHKRIGAFSDPEEISL